MDLRQHPDLVRAFRGRESVKKLFGQMKSEGLYAPTTSVIDVRLSDLVALVLEELDETP